MDWQGEEYVTFCPHLIDYNYYYGHLSARDTWVLGNMIYLRVQKKEVNCGEQVSISYASLYFFSPHTSHCNTNSITQRSPTFLAPGTGFSEDNFSTESGG